MGGIWISLVLGFGFGDLYIFQRECFRLWIAQIALGLGLDGNLARRYLLDGDT